MVTVITDKLKDQSLEDLPCDETEINAVQLRLHPAGAAHNSGTLIFHLFFDLEVLLLLH